jgi:Kef-type K+ transport system membrane component KefB
MKRLKDIFFYSLSLIVFVILVIWIVGEGHILEIYNGVISHKGDSSPWLTFTNSINQNFTHPLALLLLQIIVILIVSRLFAVIFVKIGQPTVIGEIVAGILLGPSLLGLLFPEVSSFLFPVESLGNLNVLSQIGLILFMFIVGMELDFNVLKNRAKETIVISQFSIIVPFALGMLLAYIIYTSFATRGVAFLPFSLFIGIAMSITAFPVLARIVRERGIHNKRVGTIVISCAAVNDITGWCLLAAVIAITKAGSFVSSIYVILLSVAYVLIMILVVRPFLKRIGEIHSTRENLTKSVVAIFFLTLIVSSVTTEIIGIHALFGAFMAGTIMPDNPKFRNIFVEKVEDISLVLLLPLFFVFTGLRTQIGLINDIYLWKVTGLIVLIAITGKFIGSAFAARYVKLSWKDSLTIGSLMNTRGLMELVVLNIGYELGVLTPEIFAMMVIMALLTTFMTGPSLNIINRLFKDKFEIIRSKRIITDKYKILISFGNPERGRHLLRFADSLTRNTQEESTITALHLSSTNDVSNFNIEEYESDSFSPIIKEATLVKRKITTMFKVSNDITDDIIDTANMGKFDLLLIGPGQSIYEGTLLGKILGFTTKIFNPDRLLNTVTGKEKLFQTSPFDDKIRLILARCDTPVGILVEEDVSPLKSIVVAINSKEDLFLLKYAEKLAKNVGSKVYVLPLVPSLASNNEFKEAVELSKSVDRDNFIVLGEQNKDDDQIAKSDLIIISMNNWIKLSNLRKSWIKKIPSIFIVKN